MSPDDAQVIRNAYAMTHCHHFNRRDTMRQIYRRLDIPGAGTAKRLCIAGFFSLLFLLATSTFAVAFECIDCHNPGGVPSPHDPTCQETSCLQACHAKDLNRHPSGPGTPLAGDRATACRTCHDKPFPGVYHPYKINVSAGSITPPGTADLDLSCGQCHGGGTDQLANPPQPGIPYFNKTILGAFGENIHLSKPIVRITFYNDPATSYRMNFSGADTTCPSGSCTYLWDFGDGSPAVSGINVSRTYGNGSTYTVALAVADTVNQTSSSASSPVTPQYVNQPPLALFGAGTPSASNYTVTVIDGSTDDAAFPANAITVNWGNGTISTGNAGASFTKVYTTAGVFTILLTARDAGGLYGSVSTKVTVPQKFTVSGTVFDRNGTTPLSGATVYLKQNGSTKAYKTTDATGTFSFPGTNPGTYQLQAYKYGVTFLSSPGSANPYTFNLGPDKVVNFIRQ